MGQHSKVPRRLDPMRALRSSFGLKLLAALLASVGLVLLVALMVVRRETERQVERVAERMTVRSREAFRELEELQQLQLTRLAAAFTESPRTLAALEAELEDSELEYLVQNVQYDLELSKLPHSLVVLTDASGRPVLTLRDGDVLRGDDPASMRATARQLLETGGGLISGYRAVGEDLFAVQLQPLDLGGTPVGTVALGVPVENAVVRRLGDVLGVELCFVIESRCVAGTPVARRELSTFMTGESGRTAPLLSAGRARWRLITEDLSDQQAGNVRRILAVPMDEVLQPFERIQRALVLAGGLALGLAILMGVVLSRGLSGPVRDLVAATVRVAGGNFAVRVPVRSTDEIGQLASAFNSMTEGLELKERYRGVLDKVMSRDVAEELLRSDIMLGGETRDVSTLFADITSFTALTEGMEPARVLKIVNEIMSRLGAVIEAHGAVVDKYTGDGLMALFGAPVHHPDDATRAVSAALRMQAALGELNAERTALGEVPIHIAIGIHSGLAVAGNVGSPTRLNYTVLGESVNLAARLCANAGPGEIHVSEAVYLRVRDGFDCRPLGSRSFKGFSRPVEVYEVQPQAARTATPASRAALPLVMGLLLATMLPSAAGAQGGSLPTLADLGLSYLSPSGGFQLDLSGRLDVEGYFPQQAPQWLVRATDPLVAGRLRLITDVFVGDRLYGLFELRTDRGEAPNDAPVEVRVEQLFVRVALPLPGRMQLQVGKFAGPIGGYPARHHTEDDPLIRPPLMYDYHTIIDPAAAPGALAGFQGWKDDPVRRPAGVPVIWGVPYPWGAILAAGAGKLDVRVGVTSAAPSSRPELWGFDTDQFGRGSVVAAASYAVVPELRVNAYYSRGSYLDELRQGTLPPGAELDDFFQEILGAEAVFARGPATVRAEAFSDRWNVPNIGDDVRDLSYSIEGKLKLTPGLFAAARFGEIRFNELAGPTGAERWDHNIRRLQFGAGYRLLRNTEIRAEYLLSRTERNDPRDNLFSVQWWWAF